MLKTENILRELLVKIFWNMIMFEPQRLFFRKSGDSSWKAEQYSKDLEKVGRTNGNWVGNNKKTGYIDWHIESF